MDLENVLVSESTFGFLQKRRFTARQSVAEIRSKNHVQLKPEPDNSIWNRKPPDFTPKLYVSSATYAEKMVWKKDKDFKEEERSRKVIFPELVLKKRTSNFVCRFKIIDPFEAKIMFVKTGKYELGAYKDPKDHDFRQYEAGIPNFVTSFDRDPFNLKFESNYLKTVHEPLPKVEQKNGLSAQIFETYKPQELKWDAQLILTKEHWPPRPASYTRHRRPRDAYSAFMDRVEETVTKLWQKEQELQHKQSSRIQNISVVP